MLFTMELLYFCMLLYLVGRGGGTGRHAGLKILWPEKGCAGSSPAPGTNKITYNVFDKCK